MYKEQSRYEIRNSDEVAEFFASLQLGDNQHRRNFRVDLTGCSAGDGGARGRFFSIKLRIDAIKRNGKDGREWKFEAMALGPRRPVMVDGSIRLGNSLVMYGQLETVPRKKCPACKMLDEFTLRKRCDECGEVLEVIGGVPNLQ